MTQSTLTSGHLSRCGYISSYIMGALRFDISFYMVNRDKLLTYCYVWTCGPVKRMWLSLTKTVQFNLFLKASVLHWGFPFLFLFWFVVGYRLLLTILVDWLEHTEKQAVVARLCPHASWPQFIEGICQCCESPFQNLHIFNKYMNLHQNYRPVSHY